MSGQEPDAAGDPQRSSRKRFSVEDINLTSTRSRSRRARAATRCTVQLRRARVVRRRHLPGGGVRQTGRDQAVSPRGRWAEAQLHYVFKDTSLLDLRADASQRVEDQQRAPRVPRRLVPELRHRTPAVRASPRGYEGDLSRARAALVKEPTLAAIGLALGVDAQLTLGSGELRSGGAQRGAILADAVEALLGAVLLDGGRAGGRSCRRSSCSPSNSRPCRTQRRSRTRKRGCKSGCKAGAYRCQSYVVSCRAWAATTSKPLSSIAKFERRMFIRPVKDRAAADAEQEAAAAMLLVLTGERD